MQMYKASFMPYADSKAPDQAMHTPSDQGVRCPLMSHWIFFFIIRQTEMVLIKLRRSTLCGCARFIQAELGLRCSHIT